MFSIRNYSKQAMDRSAYSVLKRYEVLLSVYKADADALASLMDNLRVDYYTQIFTINRILQELSEVVDTMETSTGIDSSALIEEIERIQTVSSIVEQELDNTYSDSDSEEEAEERSAEIEEIIEEIIEEKPDLVEEAKQANEEERQAQQQLDKEVQQARDRAEDAKAKAEQAAKAAEDAKAKADEAKAKADEALSTLQGRADNPELEAQNTLDKASDAFNSAAETVMDWLLNTVGIDVYSGVFGVLSDALQTDDRTSIKDMNDSRANTLNSAADAARDGNKEALQEAIDKISTENYGAGLSNPATNIDDVKAEDLQALTDAYNSLQDAEDAQAAAEAAARDAAEASAAAEAAEQAANEAQARADAAQSSGSSTNGSGSSGSNAGGSNTDGSSSDTAGATGSSSSSEGDSGSCCDGDCDTSCPDCDCCVNDCNTSPPDPGNSCNTDGPIEIDTGEIWVE